MSTLPVFTRITVYEEALRSVLSATVANLETAKNRLDPADDLVVMRHQIEFLKDLLARL